ncbi:hypothetical protein ACFQ51_06050 [Streptomyces kaempferi]
MSDFMNRDASAKYLSAGATSLGWGPQGLGLGYPEGAAILVSILLAIFLAWKLSGMTFQIRDIVTFRAEALFWSAILVSNTLGTSMGDFLSDSSGLGYLGGALLVSGVLAVLVALMKVPVVPNVLLFWIAFVLTRPLGATAGDLLTKPHAKGGLDLGTAGSSAVLLAALFGLMAYAQVQERRTALPPDGRSGPAGSRRCVRCCLRRAVGRPIRRAGTDPQLNPVAPPPARHHAGPAGSLPRPGRDKSRRPDDGWGLPRPVASQPPRTATAAYSTYSCSP